MAATAILNFQKVTFWTLDDTYIARIYTVSGKKEANSFSTISLAFLDRFL